MMNIRCTYAQDRGGQRLHIVPIISDEAASVALCGRTPSRGHWRMTINVPLANCCRNCMRVSRQRGHLRALEIVRREIEGRS